MVAVLAAAYAEAGQFDQAAATAQKALPPDVGVSEGIKLALKALAK